MEKIALGAASAGFILAMIATDYVAAALFLIAVALPERPTL